MAINIVREAAIIKIDVLQIHAKHDLGGTFRAPVLYLLSPFYNVEVRR